MNRRMGTESYFIYMDFNEHPNFKFCLGWKTFGVSEQFRDEDGLISRAGIESDSISTNTQTLSFGLVGRHFESQNSSKTKMAGTAGRKLEVIH